MSSPNHSTSDIEDAFSSMNILNYTSVSSDYFPASSGSKLLPPKKRIHSPSSSSTTLSNSSRNQTCDLISPSSSVYTPTPPQIFEIGKCSVKMHLKHHEKQIEDILNYLDELSFHRIEKMEERRINGNELKTELKEIRTQIIKLQKKRTAAMESASNFMETHAVKKRENTKSLSAVNLSALMVRKEQ
ncbi:hypothetical protein Tco_0109144 [Tanacetum coccineum]